MNVGGKKYIPETDCKTENIHITSELVCSLANWSEKLIQVLLKGAVINLRQPLNKN